MADNPLRRLPPVSAVLAALKGQEVAHERVVGAIRAEIDAARERLLADATACPTPETIVTAVLERLRRESASILRPVINATGVILHTNLGRAPLPTVAANAARTAGIGYLNLELDIATGKRSSRVTAVRDLLCQVTGAESATVVNNCAAATVLVLRTLAAGREVVVSRGQLVEIGGGFRIPDIMAVSGATLQEVGTTNITRIADFERAITPATAMLLRVHQSNFRTVGFTKSASLDELVALGRRCGALVVDDVGSGALLDYARFGLTGEPVVSESVRSGADLVLFSGDKLLGGPQAGMIVGRRVLIDRIERDPLMRAFRLDKMTLAALEATLRLYRDGKALSDVPVLRLLAVPLDELRRRSALMVTQLSTVPGLAASDREDTAPVGGGSIPGQSLPTMAIDLVATGWSDDTLAMRLRTGMPSVMARIQDGRVRLDLRSVPAEQDSELVAAVAAAIAPKP